MNETADAARTQVICPATRDNAVRLFIIAAMMIGFGVYCYADKGNFPRPNDDEWNMQHPNKVLGYVFNHYGPFVLIPVGLILAGLGARSLRRKLIADGEGFGYEDKQKVPWSDVIGLDASRLKDKQILVLRHGQGQETVLDRYKLQNFKELVAFVERHVATGDAPADAQEPPSADQPPAE